MKFVITCALPSGSKWCFSGHKGTFALVPVKDGEVRKAFAWDTEAEAQAYLDEQLRVAPDLDKLGPFKIEPVELPQ